MKHLAAAALAVLFVLGGASAAWASDGNTIPWTGHGDDNLPCEAGGHWVLAPAFGIDSATLTVDGTDYVMVQNGEGSWAADSVGPIDDGVDAYVTYTGAGDERDQLQLSHCTEGSPTPTPTPTETPSPTPTESPTPTNTPTKPTVPGGSTVPPQDCGGKINAACSHSTSLIPPASGRRTAFTGGVPAWMLWTIGGGLVIGTGALWWTRRRITD
jgi:hypothetical protein